MALGQYRLRSRRIEEPIREAPERVGSAASGVAVCRAPARCRGVPHARGRATAESGFDQGRRQAVIRLIAAGAALNAKVSGAQPQSFAAILAELSSDPDLTAPMRRHDELDGSQPGLERAPVRSTKSSVTISPEATELIIACEVSSRAVYEKLYLAPVWPKGKSGLTIGIGYDIGYVDADELKADWGQYLAIATIVRLSEACRITGTAAAALAESLSSVQVDWKIAKQQFDQEAKPRYVGMTRAALPQPEQLNGSTLGALVSLVYNRGPSFSLAGDRYSEMRNIKEHLSSGDLGRVPNELRCMKRLWAGMPDMRGVVLRREAEAKLFESGLAKKV